jgi:hypothetical protein
LLAIRTFYREFGLFNGRASKDLFTSVEWTKGKGMKKLSHATLRVVLALALSALVFFGQQADPTSPSPSKEELKKQKKAEKKAAKEAARAARESSDHTVIPLAGSGSQALSGEPGCITMTEMAFHRDVVRGWGGLLGGGNNAFLGVTSSLRGVASNACTRETAVFISAEFYNSSGVQLGLGSTQILVPATQSNSFEIAWSCADGVNYTPIGSSSVVWIPNCPASTARYTMIYR